MKWRNKMKKIISSIFILSLIILMGQQTFAVESDNGQIYGPSNGEFNKVGASGMQMLKIGVGARATGMGSAYGAIADDLTALYWNPAGLAKIKDITADFHYTSWFADFNHSFAAIAMPVGENFTSALSVSSFGTEGIPITTVTDNEGTGSTYSVNDIAIGLSFSGYLTEEFSFGITGKYLNCGLASLSSDGFAFDIGTLYETGIQGINLGFSIHNLGSSQTYSGEDLNRTIKIVDYASQTPIDASFDATPFSIPLIFRAALSADIIEMDEHKVIGAFDFLTYSDVPEQFHFGAEYTYDNMFALRAGYIVGQDQLGLSGGVGLNYIGGGFAGKFDYSLNTTVSLGMIHRISISLGMN
jgi:hypothetical protein